jgi:hypothetical protein
MQIPHESHWKTTKRILRYVRGTIQFKIHYSSGGTPLLVGFTIQIGPTTLMIGSLLQVMFSALVQDLTLGPVRKKHAIALSSA